MEAEETITPKALAYKLGLKSVNTVYAWINDGLKVSRTKGTSGAITIKMSDYMEFRRRDAGK